MVFQKFAWRAVTRSVILASSAALGLGLVLAAPAGAATYTDTSLQAGVVNGYSVNPAVITGTVTGKVLTFAAIGSEVLSGASISGGAGGDLVLASSATAVTLTGSSATATAPYVLTFRVNSGTGSTDVETVSAIPEAAGVPTAGTAAITDSISTITTHNNNGTGAVEFGVTGTTSALGSVTEGNLPGGLVSGNPLVPGTAVPGTYGGVTVVAADAAGSVLSGHFGLKVNATKAKVHKNYTGAISNFWSGKCLDTAGRWFTSGGLVQWDCGSSGGTNQRFELYWTGSAYELRALDWTHPSDTTNWVVSTDGVTGHELVLQPGSLTGTPPAGQRVVKSGAYYEFAGTAQVINDAGYSKLNGGWVIGWPLVPGASNEKWSLP